MIGLLRNQNSRIRLETIYLSRVGGTILRLKKIWLKKSREFTVMTKSPKNFRLRRARANISRTKCGKLNLRQTLADAGFDEAISYSFIDTRNDEKFDLIPNFADENLDEKFISLQRFNYRRFDSNASEPSFRFARRSSR